jgi:predicted amidohydrolase YtcJ
MIRIVYFASLAILFGCYKGKSVDLIIHNAEIHTMEDGDKVVEAMAIKDGKIVEVGPERQILNKYAADEIIDASGRQVYPGFTDAHGHMLSYAEQRLSADLVGTKSFEEVLVRLEKYQAKFKRNFIIGRGWDQSLWGVQTFPSNEKINALFPNTPVCLIRIDGHAMLVNDALLKKAGITSNTVIPGGIIHLKEGKCTGMLVDNAMQPVYDILPEFPRNDIKKALLDIQQELFQQGITGVHEAGIDFEHISLFQELIKSKKWDLFTYAMLMPSEKNKQFAKLNGPYVYKNLSIRSFKVIADGALGSRGALLKQPYSDDPHHHGVLTTPLSEMNQIAQTCLATGYQMNVHAIGDSTNRLILELYGQAYAKNKDHRWRIEHAQVVDPKDFELFAKYAIFPSVQPTHAISDQRWAEARLGKKRMRGAYAYRSLLNQYGMLAIGTDFPIEITDPFRTIHAATNRKNEANMPNDGFYMDESLDLFSCLSGMTRWAAFASFQEERCGLLTAGMDATFVILEEKIGLGKDYRPNFSWMTVIGGKKVFQMEM